MRPKMKPIGCAAPMAAKLRFLMGPSGIELPKIPTPEGMSIAAAKPRPAQQPMSPPPVFWSEVAIDMAAKIVMPSRKTGLLPNASAIPPAMSRSAPLTSENIDNGHDSSSCDRLTVSAMEGSAIVRAPPKKLVRMVTPQIETSDRTMRVVADSFGAANMLDSFLEESTPRLSSFKLPAR